MRTVADGTRVHYYHGSPIRLIPSDRTTRLHKRSTTIGFVGRAARDAMCRVLIARVETRTFYITLRTS